MLLLLAHAAFAHSAGQTGNSTTGCNCHGATATGSTSVSMTASDLSVAPGDVVNVSLAVSTTSSSRTHAGLDVSTTGGTFGAGTNTQVVANEATHTAATAMSSGSVTFNFTWTAPAAESTYTLRGAGLAVNNNRNDGGDAWNLAPNVNIVVDDGCDDLDGDGWESCLDGSGDDCDDSDASLSPGEPETCDGIDNDCDLDVDEASAVDAETWYLDADADGYGLASSFVVACDLPAGYSADDTDCDDGADAVHPAGIEACDGIDNDCDGVTDPDTAVDASTWFLDTDGDGYAGSTTTVACTAPIGAGTTVADCDDTLPAVHPAATETCDGVDQDCDGDVDEAAADATTYYLDADGDSYGLESATLADCSAPSGYVAFAGDCDDADAGTNPGAAELCTDTVDRNCDGSLAYADDDADGYAACEECNDADAAVYPGAAEVCNGVDDDCDGTIDPDTAVDAATWYTDADLDGYGDAGASTVACTAPLGARADATDCDDADPTAFPGAPETCDGVDDDCDGGADEGATDALPFYADADGDGYGNAASPTLACSAPTAHVADASDCDDGDDAVNPAALEVCNTVDDDCDAATDEPDAADAATWYADTDGDGYGDALRATVACVAPEGFVADASDCDDTTAGVHPGATQIWYDGVDDDCDGNDADADLDGWPSPADCDDAAPTVNPDAEEVWYDGVDADCDGRSDYDADGDDFESEAYGGTDCDDADPTTYAGAPDTDPDDGVEHDCDVRNDHDRDDDGYDDEALGGPDCDDASSAVHPDAEDVPGDGIDQDCDGADAEPDAEAPTPECGGCAHAPGAATVAAMLTLVGVARRRR